jgi:hypothetical protein
MSTLLEEFFHFYKTSPNNHLIALGRPRGWKYKRLSGQLCFCDLQTICLETLGLCCPGHVWNRRTTPPLQHTELSSHALLSPFEGLEALGEGQNKKHKISRIGMDLWDPLTFVTFTPNKYSLRISEWTFLYAKWHCFSSKAHLLGIIRTQLSPFRFLFCGAGEWI